MTTASDEAPRARDVGLLLAGNALAALHANVLATPATLDALHEWYLCHVCFADLDGPDASAQGAATPHEFPVSHDVDFHLAGFESFRHGADNGDVHSSPLAETPLDTSSSTLDEGLCVLITLIHLVSSLQDVEVGNAVCAYLLDALHGDEEDTNTISTGTHRMDVSMLSTLFTSIPIETTALYAVGSATTSYRVWACVAWNSASFPHQTALTELVAGWARALRAVRAALAASDNTMDRNTLLKIATHGLRGVRPPAAELPPSSDGARGGAAHVATSVDLRASYALLRGIMEGLSRANAAHSGASVRSLLTDNASGESYVAKLLALQGSSVSQTVGRGELAHQGTIATLFHIAAGMIAYVQFHLSIRALSAARQCAQMAVLVGHQIRSDALLALAHYSLFLVNVASGLPTEAADSLSVAMHLSTATNGSTGAAPDSAEATVNTFASSEAATVQTSSLCYLGAAQLLLSFPSCVGAPLRSAMTTSALWEHVQRHSRGEEEQTAKAASYDPAATTAPTHASIIAADVQQALWLSEVEALYRPSPTHSWIATVTRISRETARMMGAVYGLASAPQSFTGGTLASLLGQIDEERRVSAPSPGLEPREALLAEVRRHTAYRALVSHEGYLCVHTNTTPLELLRDFRQTLQTHCGPGALATADADEFFSGVARYLCACRVARQGFVACAFESLTDLLVHLCRLFGLEELSTSAAASGERVSDKSCLNPADARALGADGAGPDDTIYHHFATATTRRVGAHDAYISPDWLFLLAHVQLERAELAAYLGYTVVLDTMALALERISLRAHSTFGVLCARWIAARAAATRWRHSEVHDQLVELEAACLSTGLVGLLTRVRKLHASVAAQREDWATVDTTLKQLEAQRCPPLTRVEQVWPLRLRLDVMCRLAESQRQACALASDSEDSPQLSDTLSCVLRRGVQELSRHPSLCDTTAAGTCNDALLDSVPLLSTLVRANTLLGDETCTDTQALLYEQVRLLQSRQLDLASPPITADLDSLFRAAA